MKRLFLKILFIVFSSDLWSQTTEIVYYAPNTDKFRKKINSDNYIQKIIPAGVVEVIPNFFCDEQEVSNSNWHEYEFWTKQIFGKNSNELFDIMPDTSVWIRDSLCQDDYYYPKHYYRHAAYDAFPLVGTTQLQALNYSRWRSDRFFEYLLINLNKIEWDSVQNRNNYFTIERYYNDTLNLKYPGDKVKYYPNYRLPTLTERRLILSYADSIDKSYFAKCHSKYCKECKASFPKFNSDVRPCLIDSLRSDLIIPTYKHYSALKGNPIYNLRGNVSEWSAIDSITLGGGWLDHREKILESDTFHIVRPNAWTGFRNVCEWKEWK